jgi:histidinol phosphatase-like PHP family hydrolase
VRASDFTAKYVDDFRLVPGVELTHVPPKSIPSLAREAKKLGAVLVVVHGETPVEPVQEGTDDASCRCQDVDILAHPGMITEEAMVNAKENGIFLELSYRGGHCLGNGHVARLAKKQGAMLLVDSDAHNIGDHMTPADALGVAQNSGLSVSEAERVVFENPNILLKRLK